MLLSIVAYFAIAAGTALARDPPTICITSPLATILPGQSILARVNNPQGAPCVATLVFAAEEFLPITFSIGAATCLGFQQAQILVPMEVPNGLVTVLWECAGNGLQSCSTAWIAGGEGDFKQLVSQQTGNIECVVPSATVTTFSTIVTGTSTILEAIRETLFATTTTPPNQDDSTTLSDKKTTSASASTSASTSAEASASVSTSSTADTTAASASTSTSSTADKTTAAAPVSISPVAGGATASTSVSTACTSVSTGATTMLSTSAVAQNRAIGTSILNIYIETSSACSSQVARSTNNASPYN